MAADDKAGAKIVDGSVEVGVLTPVTEEAVKNSPAWDKFKQKLLNLNKFVNLTFKYADGDDKKLEDLAQDLVDIDHIKLIVADGTTAARIVQNKALASLPILQIVGGDPAPGGNLTGFHIDAKNTMDEQLVRLTKKFSPSSVTVMYDAQSVIAKEIVNNFLATSKLLSGLPISNRDDLKNKLAQSPSPLVGSLMLVPSAIFFHEAQLIADAVEAAKINAIYPEREFKDAHKSGYRKKVIVHGHNIKHTFANAADYADYILRYPTAPLPPSQEAATDADPDDDEGAAAYAQGHQRARGARARTAKSARRSRRSKFK